VTESDDTIEASAHRDLQRLEPDARTSALAATALMLARQLDNPARLKALEIPSITRELRATLTELAKAAPEQETKDGLDELAGRRAFLSPRETNGRADDDIKRHRGEAAHEFGQAWNALRDFVANSEHLPPRHDRQPPRFT
jgi:hypothetical protein